MVIRNIFVANYAFAVYLWCVLHCLLLAAMAIPRPLALWQPEMECSQLVSEQLIIFVTNLCRSIWHHCISVHFFFFNFPHWLLQWAFLLLCVCFVGANQTRMSEVIDFLPQRLWAQGLQEYKQALSKPCVQCSVLHYNGMETARGPNNLYWLGAKRVAPHTPPSLHSYCCHQEKSTHILSLWNIMGRGSKWLSCTAVAQNLAEFLFIFIFKLPCVCEQTTFGLSPALF